MKVAGRNELENDIDDLLLLETSWPLTKPILLCASFGSSLTWAAIYFDLEARRATRAYD